tara:strand:- start:1561 stop:2802 length:1242 start_codon:yes stop_codon:yes gene_type:complete
MTGTVMAQAIGYMISPFLTRIYSTEEMGELGIYIRLIGFVSAFATARYELSLPLPKSEAHSFLLYKFSLKITKIVVICMALLFVLFYIVQPFEYKNLYFIVFTIVGTYFLVFINLGTNWSIRTSNFKKISQQRVISSVLTNALKWILGIFSFGAFGLILATVAGYTLSSLAFVREYLFLSKSKYKGYSKRKIKVLALEYKEYPLVSLPHVLIDLGRDLVIAGLIVYFFKKDVFGSYNHSYAMLKIPMVIIGTSVGQVFFNKCTGLVNEGKSIYSLMRRTLVILIGLSIVPFTIMFFFGEPLFDFVFSAEWGESGYFSEIMTIWLLMNFLMSPLSSLPLVLKRQGEYFILGLIGSILQLIGFGLLPIIYGGSKETFVNILWFVSISQAIYLLIIILISLHYAKVGMKGREHKLS